MLWAERYEILAVLFWGDTTSMITSYLENDYRFFKNKWKHSWFAFHPARGNAIISDHCYAGFRTRKDIYTIFAFLIHPPYYLKLHFFFLFLISLPPSLHLLPFTAAEWETWESGWTQKRGAQKNGGRAEDREEGALTHSYVGGMVAQRGTESPGALLNISSIWCHYRRITPVIGAVAGRLHVTAAEWRCRGRWEQTGLWGKSRRVPFHSRKKWTNTGIATCQKQHGEEMLMVPERWQSYSIISCWNSLLTLK